MLFAAWLAVAGCAAWKHVPWRDEVRAWSLALQGENVFAMLRGIHGEGHPALWYLLVRAAHTLFPVPQVLQALALLVAAAAVLVLLLRAPFGWPVKALILAGNGLLFEYSVMARNYGISVLLMFLFALCYPRQRTRGILLGVLLALLANTNVHSVVLAGGFLLLWAVDLARERNLRWNFWCNAAIALAGVAVFFLTVYPPVNDSALHQTGSLTAAFRHLAPWLPFGLLAALLAAATFGLRRHSGAFLASLFTLAGCAALFTCVYPGLYRHEALWLMFLVCCYWIANARSPLFLALLAIQVPIGTASIAGALGNSPPLSRSRDLAELLRQRPELRHATIVAEPDYLVESLPYYLPNPTYLLRRQSFGNVVPWSRRSRLQLNLDDVLASARSLPRPVVILLGHKLEAGSWREGYAWQFSASPEQVRTFAAATGFVAHTAPSLMGEDFDVYLLK